MTGAPTLASLRNGTAVACRYLAFLDQERRHLPYELFPDRKPGDRHFFPCDRQVNCLYIDGASPRERHGDDVPVPSAMQADKRAEAGDVEGKAVRRVVACW